MNVGIIGCGLIGNKRAKSILANGDRVVMACDTNLSSLTDFGFRYNCKITHMFEELVANPDIDAVVISTPNKYIKQLSTEALYYGKHVLCEKPPGRNLEETKEIARVAKKTGKTVKVGFNHRFHPGISYAKSLCDNNVVGDIMYIRSVYGHGGREGYEKEWRMDKEISGGGELLDQGVHIIDLSRWFLGEFAEVFGDLESCYWKEGIEDNVFAFLRTEDKKVSQFQTSWTQWKNKFSFEIYGNDGYILVNGLGGSYGKETVTVGKRSNKGIPTEDSCIFDYDDSWDKEWDNFATAIKMNIHPYSDIEDAVKTMEIVDAIYKSDFLGRMVFECKQ